MKNKELAIIIISIVLLITLSLLCRFAMNEQRKELNNIWIQELSERELIIKNESGSFTWR